MENFFSNFSTTPFELWFFLPLLSLRGRQLVHSFYHYLILEKLCLLRLHFQFRESSFPWWVTATPKLQKNVKTMTAGARVNGISKRNQELNVWSPKLSKWASICHKMRHCRENQNLCLGLPCIISQNTASIISLLHDAKFIVSKGFVLFTLYMKLG